MKKEALIFGIVGVLFLILPVHPQTWNMAKRLTWTSGGSYAPAVAVNSNNHIHVVWQDDTPGNDETLYKRSTNGGTTWTTKRLTWTSEHSWWPAIAIGPNDHIQVVYQDYTPGNFEIYHKKSTNGGATWTTKRITWTSSDSFIPYVAVDSNNHIHVVWQDWDPGNAEILYKKSTNGGATWTTKRLTWTSGTSTAPEIAVDSSQHFHVVWQDETPGNEEIYYKKSTDGGATWSTKRLTQNSGYSRDPSIAIDSNDYIHLVWWDSTPGSFEAFYKKSTNGGATWTTKRLTWNSTALWWPDIAVDSNNHLHVIYWERVINNYELYHKRSTNGGTTWATKRLTWNSGNSWFSSVAISPNDHIHVVWRDDTPGNNEIYYRKGIQ
jgi:hypothetical protein